MTQMQHGENDVCDPTVSSAMYFVEVSPPVTHPDWKALEEFVDCAGLSAERQAMGYAAYVLRTFPGIVIIMDMLGQA